ncbi:nucleotide sugar dehydrogenase [Anaeromicrobium sediminis]|uniref:UDP-N-acetyl-D-mannosamine dehydrogenase n=1 Tax=Anaeromicrobium sediminis TaxID=1478221 RepID=A0A267MHB0_9FIRM|nr:nucleotide sugar dehydrogenase [Anaeromicrobium sediminis]PAB58265.1 UDP-N-acetyl-D-mannosamine dehydrogenase [Anaeromicrobium sediminis]
MKKICVVGLGYIGLPTSAMFAHSGVKVVGVDVTQHVVDTLNKGQMHIEEPGLDVYVKEMVETGMFRAQTEPEEADAFIVAVPTPNKDNEYKGCDLKYVVSATKAILPYVKKGNLIIIESTIGPRTIDDVIKPLVEEAGFVAGKDIYLAHCPERVLPGQIIREMVENSRICGGYTRACAEKAAELYKAFVKGEIVITDAKTAEMSKLMENTFRDVNIALANELAKVCNYLDVNVLDVIQMANKHPRVNLHTPGPGVGGHCLAVDPYFIVDKAPELAKIINLSRETNCSMPAYVVENVEKILKDIKDPKISVFGLTYKGNIDDMRESPAMDIVHILKDKGHNVVLHDPHVCSDEVEILGFNDAIIDSDMILILADHNEFKNMDLRSIEENMSTPYIFDTKNIVQNINIKAQNPVIMDEVAATKEKGIVYINYGNLSQHI